MTAWLAKVCVLCSAQHKRHTFASHAVMRGVPLKLVQEWLGHATIQMTMRYSHLADGLGDEMIKRLAPRSGDLSVVGVTTAQHNDSTRSDPVSNSGS